MTPPLALYVHWPYCARICPYCDFNVVKARHLYPRSLTPPFTPADEAVLTALARQSQRFVAESVNVSFEDETDTVAREVPDELDTTPWSEPTD